MKRILEKYRQLTSAGVKTFAYDGWGNTNKETDANGKVTDIVYDQYGRIVSKTTPELSTTYTYNPDGLLQAETSTNGTGKNMTYDGLGRTLTFKETGAGGKWLQKSYTYSEGKIATISYATQSGTITTETSNYQNGYLKSITLTGGQVIYDLQQENAMGMPTKVLSGPVTRNYSFDQYGMPTGRSAQTQSAGTYMKFEYNFNATTGNLNYRKDLTRNITENFSYDNLNRLTGFAGQTVSYDNKGNITQKSGIGNYHYLNNAKPYALTGIVQSGSVIPERQQQISYASFSRPLTITEDGYTAQFIYEAGSDRVKMQVTKNGAPVLTRHYLANQYELDEKPGSTREKLYLGGDYYSAGAVLMRDNGGTWQVFYINSDYLGSVTHVINSAGSVIAEYSYDAWGRLRNPVTHAVYRDGQQPELFLGRGYTGHEHLNWCGLINMNARLYDPVHGRFLAPDPYVQAPDFTQSFNRYGYAWGNPLIYTDPDGEFFIWTAVTFTFDLLSTAFFKGGLDFTSKSARLNAWKSFDPTAQWSATNRAWKIDIGQFKTDPNRTTAGRFLQLLSRFTWELPQTVVGKSYSHIRNIAGDVSNVDYYGGATLVNGNTSNRNDRWGMTLGSYINGRNLEADPNRDDLFRHEYGHTLQSRLVGPLYLTSVGIPSLIGQVLDIVGLNDHNREWYETQANRMAFNYFRKHSPDVLAALAWDDDQYPRKYKPNWYWIFSHPPIIFSWWLFF